MTGCASRAIESAGLTDVELPLVCAPTWATGGHVEFIETSCTF